MSEEKPRNPDAEHPWSFLRGLRDAWASYTHGIPRFEGGLAIFATLMLICADMYGDTGFYRTKINLPLQPPFNALAPYLYWFASSILLYFAFPAVYILASGRSLRDFGIGAGDWKIGLKITAAFSLVMILIIVIAVRSPSFSDHYPMCKGALKDGGTFLLYESGYVLYFFSWEFLFRGFLLFGLYRVIGNWAIILQMIPFALLHVGKPDLEVFSSVLAGLILGALTLRTRSMFYAFLLHAISAVSMDAAVLIVKGFTR